MALKTTKSVIIISVQRTDMDMMTSEEKDLKHYMPTCLVVKMHLFDHKLCLEHTLFQRRYLAYYVLAKSSFILQGVRMTHYMRSSVNEVMIRVHSEIIRLNIMRLL